MRGVAGGLSHCAALCGVLFAPGTRHQSYADTATWAPPAIGRRMGALGPTESMHAMRLAAAAAIHEHIRDVLSPSTTTTPASPPTIGEAGGASEAPVFLPFELQS